LRHGMVEQGQTIINRDNIVTEEKYQVLTSLKKAYEGQVGQGYLLFIGYVVIIAILFILYAIQLEMFGAEDIYAEPRSLVLILINIVLFTMLTAYMVRYDVGNVYIVPYCIVPIVLLAFFGIRLALVTHLLVILICGLMVPNPYEFVLIEVVAGVTAILSMARIRYISQFFVSALLIFMMYSLTYYGISFMQSSTVEDVQWSQLVWFGGNFLFTLIAYPLIYVNEKVFGFLSDISLLELSDINNKLLKDLFTRAPGTFQHSLQVANLSEAIIDRIGGNALLTRVGALYHDIGKVENPEYFIENQKYSISPHEGMDEKESADIIIGHVTRGIEIAQEHRLPKAVVDFIRTHHGTTRVDFFYRNYMQKHPEEGDDDSGFRYPGPKPFSKETAVVMITDSVEAASRSLKEPDEKQLEKLVDMIIDSKIQDNQFDYATITIHDINTARRVLKKLLKSIYHIRIQYPADEKAAKK
ncbi:MAG: HDIG domain-containing protein, partial [Bacteroidota bacterium]|nr:HDIG domain-containing protein [Bacteroidota bacterium]